MIEILGEAAGLLLGLGEFVGQCVSIFGCSLAARFTNGGRSCFRLAQMTFLDGEILLLLDQLLKGLKIGEFRAQFLFHERLTDVDALLDDRNCRLQLMNRGSDRALLGFLLRLLPGERGDLGAVLGHLVEQQLALGTDQCLVRARRRREFGRRIISAGERRTQPCDIELLGEKVIVQVITFRRIHGRIELDQHVAGLDRLSVLHPNGPHHACLERLDDLGAAARNDFSARRCNDVERACRGPDQRNAEKQYNGRSDRTADRRRRRFYYFKRRRQERQLFAALRAGTTK